jgi:hypothetical protein
MSLSFTIPARPPVQQVVPGLKKALIIGINYYGTNYKLAGCINDALNASKHLQKHFPMCRLHRIITDVTAIKPTRKNILDSIKWLVSGLKPGEHVYFHYSGHGGLLRDTNGDEVTGQDSCIYPVNGTRIETITDDELRTALADSIPAGSKCFAVLDCCHSGSALDLRYNVQTPSINSLVYREDKKYEKTKGQVIFISGCKDDQTAADTVNSSYLPCGALTWALFETWNKWGPSIKLKYVLWDVLEFLKKRGYSQVPQLNIGQYSDMNSVFDLRIA